MKMIIIIVVAVLALAGGAAYFFLGNSHKASPVVKKEEEPIKIEQITFVQLPEMIINLKAGKGNAGILKAVLILELVNPKDKELIDHLKPLIVDQCQTYLRELEVADLQGSAGLERVRQEVKNRVSNLVAPAQVRQVLYKDFLVQ